MAKAPEMVERVARALSACDGPHWDSNAISDDTREEWYARARAAITAMREPTEAMLEAGHQRFDLCWSLEPGEGLDESPPEPIWRAMIDAALS